MKKILQVAFLILFITSLIVTQTGCGKRVEKKSYEILIKNTEQMTIVYLEHTGSYEHMESVFGQLGGYAAQKGISGNMAGIYYDDPSVIPAESLRSEIGFVIPDGFMPDSGYGIQTIPARKVVYAILKGPYDKIASEYDYIKEWITKQGYKMKGAVTEIYLEGGPNIPPEQYVTEVQFPIE